MNIPCRSRTALLSQCSAARPDFAMLEGSTLPILLDAVLTLRQVVHAHRSLLADGSMLNFSAGWTSVKYLQELFWFLSKPLAPSCSRFVQRHLSSCQEGARGACSALPSTAAPLGRAATVPLVYSRALGSLGVQDGRYCTYWPATLSLLIGSNFQYVFV